MEPKKVHLHMPASVSLLRLFKVVGSRKDLQNSDLMGLGYCLGESHHTDFVPRNMPILKFLKING
jgi:hypothetical protein